MQAADDARVTDSPARNRASAAAFINRGSASRFTFLLSPEAATVAGDLLRRYDALACERAPKLTRYAPLRL